MNNDEIRNGILRKRDLISSEKLEKMSRDIKVNLGQVPAFRESREIMFYASFRSEVITLPIIEECLAEGKTVALPLTSTLDHRLSPHVVKNFTNDTRKGYCGIPEPDPEQTRPLSPGELDLVVVPGSVFDRRGGRLGYGGGFYDRFLANEAPQAYRLGVAFSIQLLDEDLPLEPHDQKLDCLVTDQEVIFAER